MGFLSKLSNIFKKKDDGIVVLSLLDGIGGAYLALNKAGIKVKKYYASEIDKHAIHQSQINFPGIKHLGDIRRITKDNLPSRIDLVIGGSPCQSFIFTGSHEGESGMEELEITTLNDYLSLKNEGFNFKSENCLFWEFVRVLEEVKKNNPDVKFLLENVGVGKKWEDVITAAIGTKPYRINSKRVSGQNRKRLYWTNICEVIIWDVYKDNAHPLYEYLEDEPVEKDCFLPIESVEKILDRMDVKSVPKTIPLGVWLPYDDYNHKFPKCITKIGTVRQTFGNKAPANGYKLIRERVTGAIEFKDAKNVDIRILTPTECANLQTIPKNYQWDVSDRQMYKLLGNTWTVDVVAKIVGYLKRK